MKPQEEEQEQERQGPSLSDIIWIAIPTIIIVWGFVIDSEKAIQHWAQMFVHWFLALPLFYIMVRAVIGGSLGKD